MIIYIYSRKSKWTGRGESVENQIAMCREYMLYNIEGADKAEIVEYEDEGYSGKNTNRPQFQKMMSDIKKGQCDYLVCYKLDRLGRNIADLANLIETLNKLNVSFISIKERFDTSTPIGKAMIYFAGVLAQMEREQIAERVRDNMIMLARKGRWLGGNTPLGFRAEAEEKININGKNKKCFRLKEDAEDMKITKFIFQEFLEKQSLVGIVKYFLSHGMLTKRGKEYTTTTIKDILTNPVYCTADQDAYKYFWDLGCQVCMDEEEADGRYGLISYAKTSSSQYKNQDNPPEKWIIALGRHKGIISGKDFVKIQKILKQNSSKGDSWHKPQNPVALLSGLLYCSCGHAMRPKNYSTAQVTENGDRKFSYLCPYKDLTHGEKCSVPNVQGNTLDRLVCEEVLSYTDKNSNIGIMLERAKKRIMESKTDKVTEGEVLEQEIIKRKKEVKNLITAIAKSGNEEFIKQIEEEITRLNEECAAFEKERGNLGEEKCGMQGDQQQIEFVMEQLSSFKALFPALSVVEKREYLHMILERVVWDGEEAHIFIYGSH
ncbi:recombinase family protein [Clostridium sp. AF19-22AC]|uniref:recombinase family protein n=1 Tax=Clostridia TaxID=186801 RepID=UPI000E4F05F8|nr:MULTISPECIES: recombinase family protein [Clostridia]RHR27093.1 recombinase family protein [Clostridium sp. AF19-22AC]